MSEKPYQKHIELAIQNVLSKVKNPGRPDLLQKLPAKAAAESPQPTSVRPAPRRSAVTGALSESDAPAPAETHSIIPTFGTGELPAQAESPNEEPILYEAEDLFTPLQTEDLNPEPEEPPLQEDTYQPPYNLFEEFVETELDILLSRYLDLCRCSQCRADIVALALHQLPAYYVTGTRGTLTAKSVIWTRYMQQVMDAVSKAIHVVYKRPRPNCGKIRQVLWLKPELEEVPAQGISNESELFAAIHQEDIELRFSDEISEIIQTLEQAPDEDKADLLPVFSPVVQKAYQQYQETEPATPSTPDPANPNLHQNDMQLLDIDNWDA